MNYWGEVVTAIRTVLFFETAGPIEKKRRLNPGVAPGAYNGATTSHREPFAGRSMTIDSLVRTSAMLLDPHRSILRYHISFEKMPVVQMVRNFSGLPR